MSRSDAYVFAVALTALILSFLLFVGLHPEVLNGNVAAWVQAVGSIAAIYAAFKVANDQTIRATQEAFERRLSLLTAATSAITSCAGLVAKVEIALGVGVVNARALIPIFAELETMRWTLETIELDGRDAAPMRARIYGCKSAIAAIEGILAPLRDGAGDTSQLHLRPLANLATVVNRQAVGAEAYLSDVAKHKSRRGPVV